MEWSLDRAVTADVDQLMTWFGDAESVDIWGGPRFRYPFDQKSFHEDCRWHEFSSYRMTDAGGTMVAFGQIGDRYDRAHLARLVVDPKRRGLGIGRRLVEMLIGVAEAEGKFSTIALFVYRHNEAALRCYRSLSFELQKYPQSAPLEDECFYLARPIRGLS